MSRGSIYAGRAVILVTAEDRIAQGLRSIRTNLRKFGNSLSGLGDSAIRGGFLGGLVSGSILRHFSQFEDKMLTLQAKLGIFGRATGRQADDIAMLEKSIRDLGATTSYTTAEVADAAISLAQAGFGPDKIKNSLKAVLDLARGTGYGLDQSAEMLANTMATFKLDGEDAVHITNMFVKATRLGTIEIDDIRESLKYASGAMKNLNEDLPVLLAFLVQMSEAGLKASLAGTSLNTALNNMLKNAEDFKKKYNVDIFTGIGADGKQKIDIVKTFKSIHEALAKLPIKDKLIAFNDMFNLRGARAVTATSDMDSIVENMKKIIDSAGEAALAAKTMDQGLGGAIRRATGAVSDFAIAVGKMNLPITKTFLETVPVALQILKDFMQQHEALVIAITLAPVGLIAAGMAFKAMAAGMMVAAAAITPLLGGLRKVASIITPGIGQQLAALGSLRKMMGGAIGSAASAGYATRGFLGRFGTGFGLARQAMAKQGRLGAMAKGQQALARHLRSKATAQLQADEMLGPEISKTGVEPSKRYQRLKALQAKMAQSDISYRKQAATKAIEVQKKIANQEKLYDRKYALEQELKNMGPSKSTGDSKKKQWIDNQIKATIPELNKDYDKQLAYFQNQAKNGKHKKGLASIAKAIETEKQLILSGASKNRSKLMMQQAKAALKARALTENADNAMDASRMLTTRKKGNVSPIRAFFSAFKGMKFGSAVSGIGSFITALANLAKGMARFAFSAGGVTTILQLLLVFGDRIPVIASAFKSLGAGFSAAFGEIAKIGDLGGNSLALIFKGAEEFSFGNTEEGIRLVTVGVQTLITIIKEQLLAAWHSFFEQIGWVYEIFKKIIVSIVEIGKLIIGLGGNFVERAATNVGGALSSLFGGDGLGIDVNVMFKEFVLNIGRMFKLFHDYTVEFNDWMFSWLYQFEKILIESFAINVWDKQRRLDRNAKSVEAMQVRSKLQKMEADIQFKEFEAAINKVFDEVVSNLAKTAKEAAQKAALEAKYKAQSELAMHEGDSFWKGDLYAGKQPPRNQPGVAEAGKELKKLIDSFVGYASHSRGNLIKAIGGKEKIEQEQLDALKGIEDGVVTLVKKGGKFVFS